MRLIENEIQQLKFKILDMAELVQFQLDNISQALVDLDYDMARKIRKKEKKIDKYDTKIDKRCERIIALHQPVANDLRFVFSVLKINSYLEQIGDSIYSMAAKVPEFREHFDQKFMREVGMENLINMTKDIVNDALMSYFNENADLSKAVFGREQKMGKHAEEAHKQILKRIESKPKDAKFLVELILILHYLEKVAGFGINIAEEAVFHLEGVIYRHSEEKYTITLENDQDLPQAM